MTQKARRDNVSPLLPEVPFLPYPVSVKASRGSFSYRPGLPATWEGIDGSTVPWIRDMLTRDGMRHSERSITRSASIMRLYIGEPHTSPGLRPSSPSPEAYRLVIDGHGLCLAANEKPGLIRGWQTLLQIREACGSSLPAGIIDDAPALQLRGFHLDLKGLKPVPRQLLELPGRLARLKYNAVLLEIEDYAIFKKHPALSHPDALPDTIWQEFARRAGDHCIEIIPLLQTWGHLQYILRLPAYRHLAESREGMIGEICPLHPQSWPLIRDLIDEVCALFPHSRYFHIGMDEIHARGKCPACKRRVAKIGMHRFVIEQLNRRFDYLAGKGRIPMFWGSADGGSLTDREFASIHNPLIIRHPDGSFTARVIGISGNYGMTGPDSLASSFAGGLGIEDVFNKEAALLEQYPASGVSTRTLSQLDARTQKRARRYALAAGGTRLRPIYEIDILQDHGFDAVGISAAQYSAGVMGLCPDFVQRQRNEFAVAQWVKSRGARGIIDTWWARGHSNVRNNAPLEAAWYGICSTADFAWRPADQTSMADFDRRWTRAFLGTTGTAATEALYAFSMSDRRASFVCRNFTAAARARWQDTCRQATRNQPFLATVDLGMEAHQLALRLQSAQLEAEYLFATLDRIPASFIRDCKTRLRNLAKDYRRFETRLRQVLRPLIIQADIDELICAEITLHLRQITQIGQLFKR